MKKNLLLTGHPGVGKTTLLVSLVERSRQYAVTGFYTQEIREAGARVGFKAVTLNGSSAVFAHKKFHTDPNFRVGSYGVRPEILENLVLFHLDLQRKRPQIVFIDEIARMEMISMNFKERVTQVLDSPVPVVATIALKGSGFVKHVKARPDVELINVTERNRDILVEQVYRKLSALLAR